MLAYAVNKSGNKKIGDASTTYVSQASCPRTCPFFRKGCYAEYGPLQWQMKKHGITMQGTAVEAAVQEAVAIRELPGERPLRLHTVGDCKTNMAASLVGAASRLYNDIAGQPVWTYTHAWRSVKRESWGPAISVLASCETAEDVKKAWKKGYATSIVVPEYKSEKVYEMDGIKVLPCPEITGRAKSCTDCRLCFNDTYLRENKLTIGFAVHGPGSKKAITALKVLNGE